MTDKVKKWHCFYCKTGLVNNLPCKCPECGFTLSKPFAEMAEDEKAVANLKRVLHTEELGAAFFLAS